MKNGNTILIDNKREKGLRSLVVKILLFHCRGPGFNNSVGELRSYMARCGQKTKNMVLSISSIYCQQHLSAMSHDIASNHHFSLSESLFQICMM